MGLDQRLTKKHYVKNWDYDGADKSIVTVMQNGKPIPGLDPKRISYVTEELATWRKANMIQKWAEDHWYRDSDHDYNCEDVWVSLGQLRELLDAVNTVLAASTLAEGKIKNGEQMTADGWKPVMEDGEYIVDPTVAQKLLPTTSGFFFGSTEYDQWYLRDLEYTRDVLERAVLYDGEFYYEADW